MRYDGVTMLLCMSSYLISRLDQSAVLVTLHRDSSRSIVLLESYRSAQYINIQYYTLDGLSQITQPNYLSTRI